MSTATTYRLVGRPESGYSVKVRSAFHFKGQPCEWLDRFKNEKLYRQHAKVPLIPLLFLSDGTAMQDSTPILDMLESAHPEPSLHPEDPALRFLSELMEEYGDEWGNKLMFHYRWGYPADQRRRGRTLAQGIVEGKGFGWASWLATPIVTRAIINRMVPRMAFAGANANNAPILVESFAALVTMLENHLQHRPYLFGARPAYGDFGLWGQMWQAWIDPSGERILNERAPSVVDWIKRMQQPAVKGDFESLESLAPTLQPIYAREIGPRFLAWSNANAVAYAADKKITELEMDGRRYYQNTFKYPAGSLRILKDKFAVARDDARLVNFLDASNCLPHLETST